MNTDFEIQDGVLVKYYGKEKHAVIPEGVVSIGRRAFEKCEQVELVTIPEGTVQIGMEAFQFCKNLKTVRIPESVVSIGDSAFWACENLKEITLPSALTELSPKTFAHCRSLKCVVIPEHVKKIGMDAFHCCDSLELVVISGKPEQIEHSLFSYDCKVKINYHGVEFWYSSFHNENALRRLMKIIDEKNFSSRRIPSYMMYDVVWGMVCANPEDEKTVLYVRRNFKEMFQHLLDENRTEMIRKVLTIDRFPIKHYLDSFIREANEKGFYEIQLMLTEYKAQKFGLSTPEETARKMML